MPQLRCPNEKCGHSWIDEQTAEHETTPCPSCGVSVSPSENAATVLFTPKGDATHDAAPVELPSEARPPQSIGPYRIDRELGRGAFGVVYECFDTRLKRAVAIKVLHATRSADGQLVQRFLREARAAANLNHPSIVAVYDLGRVGDKYYIASACVDGSSLDKQVKQLAGDWRRSAEIVRDLAGALAYAHRQKIVHRDVKPQNVMLNKAGQPLLMDFGLARWKSDLMEAPVGSSTAGLTDDAALTVAHQILGTPAYMAPEQAAAQQDQVGPASDQYSLGVMLFLFLTGRLPLRGSAVEVIKALRDPGLILPAPRAVNAAIPRDLDAICRRALARRPEDRYQDCDELAGDLEDWLNGRPVSARPLTRGERFRLWCRREPVVAALTLGVAATITLGGVSSGLLAWRASDRAAAAEAALKKESLALKRAQQQEELAVAESLRADGESAKALQARDVATRRAEDAEHMTYLADMELAQQAWDRGAPVELQRRLDRWQPTKDDPDRRRFEWHYWERLLKSFPGARAVLSQNSAPLHLPIPQTDLVLVLPANSGKDLMLYRTVGRAGSEQLEHMQTLSLPAGVASMALGPQGRLATFDYGGTITLWSVPDLTRIRAFPAGRPWQLGSLVFDKAGKTLLVWGETVMEKRRGIRRLDLESGDFEDLWSEQDLLKILSGTMQSIELSPDGIHALAQGLSVAAWLNLETRAVDRIFTFPSLINRFKACRLLADAQTVVGQSIDGQLVTWDVASGERRMILIGSSSGRQEELRLNADASVACVGSSFGLSQLWDLRTGVMLKSRRGCALPPEQFRPDQPLRGARVIVSQQELWNPRYDPDGVEVSVTRTGQPLAAAQLAVAFHPQTGEMALGGRFDSILMLDPTLWTVKRTLTIADPPTAFGVQRLRFHPEGTGLIAAASQGRAAYWDLKSDRGKFLPGEFRAESLSSVFIPGTSQVAVSSEARDIAVWNLTNHTQTGKLVGHTNYQYEWALHSNVPENIRQHALTPPIQRDFSSQSIVGHSSVVGMVVDLSAHPDGRQLASACGDGTVRIWDLASLKEIHKIFDASSTVQSVEYDRAGKLLAIGYSRGDIHIRDARTWELKSRFTGHEQGVLDLEFSPDQERLVSTSSDRTIRFWDLKTGQPVLRLDIWNSMFDPFSVVDQLAFHPNGTMLAGRTMNVPRVVRIWQSAGAMNQSQVVINLPDGQPATSK